MDPLTLSAIAIGGSLISGIAQYYQAEKARGANAAQLKKIEDMFNQIKPPDYDVSIDAPPEYHREAIASPQFAASIQSPNYDMSKLSPESLKSVGEYVPELAPLIKEVAPTTIQNTADMKTGRQAQLDALKKFTQVGEGGFDPEYEQKIQQAARSAQTEAQGRQGALMDTFSRRGLGGSGLELAAQLGSNSQAMDRLASSNQQAATDSYKNQLQALAQGAGIGGQIQSQDQSLQAQNASIINSFNQRMSQQQQDYETQRANQLNQAQVQNLANQQRISDQNAANTNQFNLNQQGRGDSIVNSKYQAALDAQKRQDSLAQQQYGNQVNERNTQNSLAQSLAQWNADQRRSQNAIKSQQYQDQMSKASGLAGNYQAQGQSALQSAADRNQALSGISGALNTGALAYGNMQQRPVASNTNMSWQDDLDKKYGYMPARGSNNAFIS